MTRKDSKIKARLKDRVLFKNCQPILGLFSQPILGLFSTLVSFNYEHAIQTSPMGNY